MMRGISERRAAHGDTVIYLWEDENGDRISYTVNTNGTLEATETIAPHGQLRATLVLTDEERQALYNVMAGGHGTIRPDCRFDP